MDTTMTQRWQPFGGDNALSDKLKGAAAKEARRLYEEWQGAEVYAAQIMADAAALPDRLREAARALEHARQREVETLGAENAIEEAKKLAALEIEAKASGGDRREQARDEVARRREALEEFLVANWHELVQEHRAHAEKINKQWLAAEATFEEAVAGLRDQHDELCASLRCVIGNVQPFTSSDVPRGSREKSGYELLAFPSSESLERREQWEAGAGERAARARENTQRGSYSSVEAAEAEKIKKLRERRYPSLAA